MIEIKLWELIFVVVIVFILGGLIGAIIRMEIQNIRGGDNND